MSDGAQELGLRCGIEIHQRIATSKLFCGCSSDLREEEPVLGVRRKLRAVAGELGEVDRAALHEYYRDREFLYQAYDGETCLVELDEEPPSPLNEEALDTALEVSLMLSATIPDEVHVMRKTVVDGSNTSGFQRTAVVGLGGKVEGPRGTIKIPTICLEEEAAGIGGQQGSSVIYRLDRLGIPLVEVATGILENYTPEEVQEVALRLGMLLRMTGKVQRGIGTIRQDVNVSIGGGARVEIKGFQEIGKLADLVRNEVLRQQSLIKIKDELRSRTTSVSEPVEATEHFAGVTKGALSRVVGKGGEVLALRLSGFAGILGRELCPGRTFGRELADHAKAHGIGGIIHTDEDLESMGLSGSFKRLSQELPAGENDALLAIAGEHGRVARAMTAVRERLICATESLPEETREPNPDATTNYKRPLPGSSRMYPETDIPPIPVTPDRIEGIRAHLSETPEVKRARFVKSGLSADLADQLVRDANLALYEKIVSELEIDPTLVANTIINTFRSLRREGVDVDSVSEDSLAALFSALQAGALVKEGMEGALREVASGRPVQEVVGERERISEDELRRIVLSVLDEKGEFISERGERAFGPIMGEVMKEVRGKIDGGLVGRVVRELLAERLPGQ